MAQRKGQWLRWLLGGVSIILLWQLFGFFFQRRTGADRLVNQLWIERMPRDPRDMVWHFLAVDQNGRRRGTLGRASRWRVASDGFQWLREGDRLVGRFPQDGCHLRLQARTWKCAGQAPPPFDLCLELKAEDRTYRYYSRTEWAIRPRAPVPEEMAWLTAALPAPSAEDEQDSAASGRGDATTCPGLGPP